MCSKDDTVFSIRSWRIDWSGFNFTHGSALDGSGPNSTPPHSTGRCSNILSLLSIEISCENRWWYEPQLKLFNFYLHYCTFAIKIAVGRCSSRWMSQGICRLCCFCVVVSVLVGVAALERTGKVKWSFVRPKCDADRDPGGEGGWGIKINVLKTHYINKNKKCFNLLKMLVKTMWLILLN